MSYRRKAPAAKTLSVTQQLNKISNAAAGPLPFQVHNSICLLEQMKEFQRPIFDKFSKETSVQKFFPARVVSEGLLPNPHLYTLPLPTHFISPDDSADDFEPRSFYHASSIEDVGKLAGCAPRQVYAPRCGLSGLFFTREEVVDNMQAAAADMGFKSPFWLQTNHPGLASGYLAVREGSDSICIGLSASVVSLDAVTAVDRQLLHPSLRRMVNEKTKTCEPDEEIPLGMNAISGQVCENPFVQGLPRRGLWLSHDQLLLHNLSVAADPENPDAQRKLFALVEVEQWELYNADQLTVPGRLGLRRSANFEVSAGVFQPI